MANAITPSVTTILDPYTDFSRISPEVLRHAANRGTKIHNAIAAHLSGLWVMPLDEECQPRFDSFRRWADIMIDKVIFVEKELHCDCYGFHGHPDAALILKDSPGVVVPDWKSPVTESKTWPSALGATIETMQDLRRWYDIQVDRAETDASMAIDITGCPILDAIDELARDTSLPFLAWPTYVRGMEQAYQVHWEVLLTQT